MSDIPRQCAALQRLRWWYDSTIMEGDSNPGAPMQGRSTANPALLCWAQRRMPLQCHAWAIVPWVTQAGMTDSYQGAVVLLGMPPEPPEYA